MSRFTHGLVARFVLRPSMFLKIILFYGVHSLLVTGLSGQALQLNFTVHPASCAENSDGSIWLGVSGGVGPYEFVWETGETTQDIVGLAAGTYRVTATDATGAFTEGAIEVGAPAALEAGVQLSDVTCSGQSDGAATGNASGGTAPYMYKWSTGVIAPSISGLSAGEYSVTVVDAKGCMAETTLSIAEPQALQVEMETTPAACDDSGVPSDPAIPSKSPEPGTIIPVVSGGTAPYSYEWSNGATTPTLQGLSAGMYKLTLTDANGCQTMKKAMVALASDLEVELTATDPTHCDEVFPDGMASVAISGGTGPYSIDWSTGESGTEITGLGKGPYSVTVTDSASCTIRKDFKVDGRRGLFINIEQEDILCADGATPGAISAEVVGGTAPYRLRWTTGATGSSIEVTEPGRYAVGVIDSRGCRRRRVIDIVEESSPEVNLMTMDAVCEGEASGSIWASVSGAVTPLTFEWSNGATTQDAENLPAGPYSVTVTDGNGCQVVGDTIVREPAEALQAAVEVTDGSCSEGGSAIVMAMGGTAPYMYKWSTGDTEAEVDGLAVGSYGVVVKDANKCMTTAEFEVATGSGGIALEVIQDYDCDSKVAIVVVEGKDGIPPYTYQWSTGDNTGDIVITEPATVTVTVTDASGCNIIESIAVDEIFTEGEAECNPDGSIPSIVSGPPSKGFPAASSSNGPAPRVLSPGSARLDGIGPAVYPNPARRSLFLDTRNSQRPVIAYRLMAADGRVLVNRPLGPAVEIEAIDLQNHPPGMYFLRLSYEGETFETLKIIRTE